MGADDFAQSVAEIVGVLREHGRRGLRAVRAEADAIEAVPFDFDARNAEIDVLIGSDLVEGKAREIEARLIDEGRRQNANPRERLGLILRFLRDIALRTTPAACVAA